MLFGNIREDNGSTEVELGTAKSASVYKSDHLAVKPSSRTAAFLQITSRSDEEPVVPVAGFSYSCPNP